MAPLTLCDSRTYVPAAIGEKIGSTQVLLNLFLISFPYGPLGVEWTAVIITNLECEAALRSSRIGSSLFRALALQNTSSPGWLWLSPVESPEKRHSGRQELGLYGTVFAQAAEYRTVATFGKQHTPQSGCLLRADCEHCNRASYDEVQTRSACGRDYGPHAYCPYACALCCDRDRACSG